MIAILMIIVLKNKNGNGANFVITGRIIQKNMIMLISKTTIIKLSFAMFVPSLKTSMSNQLLPSSSPALKPCDELSAMFGHGYLNPCKIMFDNSLQN